MAHGIVTWFDERRGFGFISRAGFVSRAGADTEIFVHRSRINTGSPVLTEGNQVRFTLELGTRGLYAADVSVV